MHPVWPNDWHCVVLGKKVGTSPREKAVADPGLTKKPWICIQHVGVFLAPRPRTPTISSYCRKDKVEAGRSSAISRCSRERMSRTWREGGWTSLSRRSRWCASHSPERIAAPMRQDGGLGLENEIAAVRESVRSPAPGALNCFRVHPE